MVFLLMVGRHRTLFLIENGKTYVGSLVSSWVLCHISSCSFTLPQFTKHIWPRTIRSSAHTWGHNSNTPIFHFLNIDRSVIVACELNVIRSMPISSVTKEKKMRSEYFQPLEMYLQHIIQIRSHTFQVNRRGYVPLSVDTLVKGKLSRFSKLKLVADI